MARSMRARKQVDYSDPGELTLTKIRQGALGPASLPKDSAGIATKKLKSKKAVASKSAAVEGASPKKKPRSPVATAPADALAPPESSAKAKKDPTTIQGGKKAAITTKSAGVESAPKGNSGIAAQSAGKRPKGRSSGVGTRTGKENASVSIAAAKLGNAKAKPSATASTAKGKSPTGSSKTKQPAVPATKRKQPPETAQGQPPAAAATTSKIRSRLAPTAFVSALIYKSPARSPAAPVTAAIPKSNQEQQKEPEVQRIEENNDDDIPTPPQVPKRKERTTPSAEGLTKSRTAGASSQGASEVVAARGSAGRPAPFSGKEIATTPRSSIPAKRQRVATPSTPGLGVAALPPRAARSLPSPVTPGVTEAQEKFLAEMARMVGALEVSGGSLARETAGKAEGDGAEKEERADGEGRGKGKGRRRNSSHEADYWKGRFEELSGVRETRAEEDLEIFRKHAAEREQAAQAIIANLRQRLSQVGTAGERAVPPSAAQASDKTPPPTTTAGATAMAIDLEQSQPENGAYVRSLEEKVEHHRKLIRLYQNLSSLAIHFKPGAGEASARYEQERPQVVTCTAVNHLHRRAVRFDLKIPSNEDSEDFVYNATGNTHLLPDYMKHELSFTRAQCPLFLTKLLQNIFRS